MFVTFPVETGDRRRYPRSEVRLPGGLNFGRTSGKRAVAAQLNAARRHTASVRRITFNSPAFFEEHLADIANGFSQKVAPLLFRPKQDQLDQALAHLRDQLGQIDRIIPFNVLSHHLVYVAVRAPLP